MNDIKTLKIPKWGLSMEEGTVSEWLIAEGDDFAEGQEICEIESSKIVNVLEAPFSGTLRKILAGPGETLPVQAPIALAAPQEVPDAAVDEYAASLGGGTSVATAETERDAVSPEGPPEASEASGRDGGGSPEVPPETSGGQTVGEQPGMSGSQVGGDAAASVEAAGAAVPAPRAVKAKSGQEFTMTLGRAELLEAYRVMRAIRSFELRVAKEFALGNVPGMTHLYVGQEAVAAGLCAQLTDQDYIASTHRGHGHCIAKGCDIHGMALELFRKAGGLCKGKGGSMHIADISKGMLGANAIVGGASPLACGAALTAKILGRKNVGVAFVGDGAINQGTTLESMNYAVALKLPVIFAIENNGYGEHTGVDYAVAGDMTERARAFGMSAEKIDGTDFFAVYEASTRALARARQGGGPSAIEAVAKRWRGHFEGDPQAYRDKDEIRALAERSDPLKLFRERVIGEGSLTADELDGIDEEVAALVDDAVEKALAAPPPAAEELLADVYVSY